MQRQIAFDFKFVLIRAVCFSGHAGTFEHDIGILALLRFDENCDRDQVFARVKRKAAAPMIKPIQKTAASDLNDFKESSFVSYPLTDF